MKLKKLFLLVTIILFSFVNKAFSKALPPGSGIGDVPANVLLMLDKSGSMGWRMSGGTASMRYPYDADADSNGDILVSQYNRDGVKKFVYGSGTFDTGFGNRGVSGKGNARFEGNRNCRTSYSYSGETYNDVYYTTAYYERAIVAIRASDGRCLQRYNLGFYPYNMTIDQSTGYLYVGGAWGYKTINLRTGSMSNCSYSVNQGQAYGSAISGSRIVYSRQNYLFVHSLSGSGSRCPSTSGKRITYRAGYYVGVQFNPNNNNELWTLSWTASRMQKLTFNSSFTGVTVNQTFGSRSRSNSTASRTYFYYPWGLGWDQANNRLIAADLNKGSVQIFNSSGTWVKNFGGAPTTRMQAAQAAIKSIVTDSSLTSGVNFGFAQWAAGRAGFSGWLGGDIFQGVGKATPCTNANCLKVPIYKGGAKDIENMINGVNPGGGTDAMAFMNIAQQYYKHGSLSPVDKNSPCQNSYVLVIGDGDWYNHGAAVRAARSLRQNQKIKTFTVAFGTGISNRGMRYFNELAKAGGTDKAIVATTAASLKVQLKAAISQIIASKLSFTAPSITATLEKGGSMFQAQFDYRQNKEWAGTITRTKINPDGSLDIKDKNNWSAADVMPDPNSRKIWSAVPGSDYRLGYNNFSTSNATNVGNLMQIYGQDIIDYHRDSNNSDGSTNNRRCANSSGVVDGIADDLNGLINFIRGQDYFDYDGDCNLTEKRDNPLGDIYHSQLVVVGAPSAETSFTSINQEAYFRQANNYKAFAQQYEQRKEIIYAGSNSGILHAFDAATGKEIWGFVPPLIAPNLPKVMNASLNMSKGGTNAMFGVDGSIVVHDMYFKSPLKNSKGWHTILFVPYGRGGAGYSVLDVTDPDKPEHLYSIYNDIINNKVYRMDHTQNVAVHDYIPTTYSLAALGESIQVTDNWNDDYNGNGLDSSKEVCKSDTTAYCYEGKVWTFPIRGVTQNDLTIIKDGSKITSWSLRTNSSSGETEIVFQDSIQYSATDKQNSSQVGIRITAGSLQTGVQPPDQAYDYSRLGETWSAPRIFRIPNKGEGDNDIMDDIYVAAMGGGYGTQNQGVGSNLTIINLEDTLNPGSIYKVIEIDDISGNGIVNSTPGSPVLITPDTAIGVNFTGALIYLPDLEGKITKFNLTNMRQDSDLKNIKIFDSTTLFIAESTKQNGRYMYHSMDATIGKDTNQLWLFAGTGDYERINDTSKTNDNLLLGIRDKHFPFYKDIGKPLQANKLSDCENTTGNMPGAACLDQTKEGWFIKLKNSAKITAEPSVYKGYAYYPIYEPTKSKNKCSLGNAYICAVDDECGQNTSSLLGSINTNNSNKCGYVGQGVLSKIVFFADKAFANLAGQSLDPNKKDLVQIETVSGDTNIFRSSWRHNY